MQKEPLTSCFSLSTRTRSLSGWTTEILRQAILDGYFEPGERLDQEGIASELQVSRTPLREAIAALESEGLVESTPHHGVFVPEVTKEDIREVFEVRAVLEAEVARQAACFIPDTVLDDLEDMLHDAQKAYEDGDYRAQFDADRCFHQTLREFTRNRLLKDVLDGVNNRINAVRRFAQMRPGPHVDAFGREHLAIIQALRQRDSERAVASMRAHLEKSGHRVQQLIGN